MRIVHVTESHEAAAGGVTTVVQDLSRRLAADGARVTILAIGRRPVPPPPGVELVAVPPSRGGRLWGWHPALGRTIDALLNEQPDVVHLHGAWLGPQWLAARASRRLGIPTVISFHGMLEPYHWSERGRLQAIRKAMYWRLMGRPTFNTTTAVHAITELEARHLGPLLGPVPMVTIPNAVDLHEVDDAVAGLPSAPAELPRRIAFLGRLHRKKGVDLLIEAFVMAELPEPWQLAIAGPAEDPSFLRQLERRVAELGVGRRIAFLPAQYGPDRWRFLRDAWVVAVPSRSEVVAMVNLEAGAASTPTLTTTATGLLDWEQGGGRLVEPRVDAVVRALREMTAVDASERAQRGAASRRLVEERYSWDVVLPRWRALYASLSTGKSTDPERVRAR